VKRSSAGEDSRAIGKYFFFCAKKKSDESKCYFARPVEEQLSVAKSRKEYLCFFFKVGKCTKGEDRCEFSHDKGLLEEAKKEDEIYKEKLRKEKELKEKEEEKEKKKNVDEKNLPLEIVKTKVESDSSSSTSSGSSSDSSIDSDGGSDSDGCSDSDGGSDSDSD